MAAACARFMMINAASFSVNRGDNYWHCFSGCGAGSIIDFYMRYQQQSGRPSL